MQISYIYIYISPTATQPTGAPKGTPSKASEASTSQDCFDEELGLTVWGFSVEVGQVIALSSLELADGGRWCPVVAKDFDDVFCIEWGYLDIITIC